MFTSRSPKMSVATMFKSLSHFRDLATTQETLGTAIVCRTNDEVNADLARSWCDDNGLDFQLTDQRDELFPVAACAIAIDLNHLAIDPKERTPFVERLCRMVLPYPVAVACYNLSPEDMGLLRTRGIIVFRHFERKLFYRLVAAIDYDRAEFAA